MPPESCFFASLESLSRLPMDALPQIRHDLALHVDDVETIRGGLPQLVGILKQEFLGAKQLYGVIRNGETGVRPDFFTSSAGRAAMMELFSVPFVPRE